jgi:hypothetical protein
MTTLPEKYREVLFLYEKSGAYVLLIDSSINLARIFISLGNKISASMLLSKAWGCNEQVAPDEKVIFEYFH